MDCQMEIAVLSPRLIFVGRAEPPPTATVIASRKAAHPRVAYGLAMTVVVGSWFVCAGGSVISEDFTAERS